MIKHVRTGLQTRPDFQSYNRSGGTALESRPHMFNRGSTLSFGCGHGCAGKSVAFLSVSLIPRWPQPIPLQAAGASGFLKLLQIPNHVEESGIWNLELFASMLLFRGQLGLW
jgi:hypothetical protein